MVKGMFSGYCKKRNAITLMKINIAEFKEG